MYPTPTLCNLFTVIQHTFTFTFFLLLIYHVCSVKPAFMVNKCSKKVFNKFPCVLAFLPVISFEINSILIASIVKKKIGFLKKKIKIMFWLHVNKKKLSLSFPINISKNMYWPRDLEWFLIRPSINRWCDDHAVLTIGPRGVAQLIDRLSRRVLLCAVSSVCNRHSILCSSINMKEVSVAAYWNVSHMCLACHVFKHN